MQCPKCKSIPLHPTKLEQGLSAMGCSACSGAIVSLLYYRDWVERTAPVAASCDHTSVEEANGIKDSKESSAEEINDSRSAMACPKCKKLMIKYKISGDINNRLDLCRSCDEAWLDGGEWELLKSLELNRKMPSVFTEEWQRKIRKQATEDLRDQRLLKSVSESELAEAKKIRTWLKDHPNKQEILFFINHE
ncbi:hypothetical protein A9Q99_15370 [Gammaproteobacteria bacterium 45_16_T64]|nr:hypothetical protein A9Q99_15370 [Gammaproteobacteria bacterium 45_16_T64]